MSHGACRLLPDPRSIATDNETPTSNMNRDILSGKWKQFRGDIKKRCGKLADNDLDQINGDYEKLVGKVQEHYGHKRDAVERELAEIEKQVEKMRKDDLKAEADLG